MLAWKHAVVQRFVDPRQYQCGGIGQLHLSSASRLPVRLSAARPRDLPGREWPSASRPLLSLCWSAPRSTPCDKNAPCTSATALRDKTPRGSPPVPGTCQKQTAARPSAHALSSAAETLSNWPCLPSSLPPPPVLREIPRHLRPSPPTAKHCAPRHPSCASTTNHRGTPMHGCPRSPGCATSRSAHRSSGSARSPCSG